MKTESVGTSYLALPATVYGARAFAAFREFYDQQPAWEPVGREQPTGHEHAIAQSS